MECLHIVALRETLGQEIIREDAAVVDGGVEKRVLRHRSEWMRRVAYGMLNIRIASERCNAERTSEGIRKTALSQQSIAPHKTADGHEETTSSSMCFQSEENILLTILLLLPASCERHYPGTVRPIGCPNRLVEV